MIIKMIKS